MVIEICEFSLFLYVCFFSNRCRQGVELAEAQAGEENA
jgi:hypothetical protein